MGVTIQKAIDNASQKLSDNRIKNARLEANSLLGHALSRDRTFIIAHPEYELDSRELQMLESFLARRAAGEPLQYLVGHHEFFKLEFEVTRDVLIPRPESEAMVEAALEFLPGQRPSRFADVGTGSGCLAISILHELPNASAAAFDISAAALKIARRNAERHNVSERLELIESDLLSALDANEQFDLIVSNPPYVPDGEIETLQPEVKHEPRSALAGGPDGLSIIKRLLAESPRYLRSNGRMIFEFGFGQHERLLTMIDSRSWELIETRNDLQGIPRTIILRKV